MKKQLLLLFILVTGFSTGFAQQISVIGSATPANNWYTDFNMQQDTEDSDLWMITLQLSADELKFRQDSDWGINWGGIDFPSGIGVPEGGNLPVPQAGIYKISFTLSTAAYNFTLISAGDGGNVGIGTSEPDHSAALDIFSLDKGLLIPRMNGASRNAIAAPAVGLLVFDSSTNSFWFYGSGGWQEVASDADPDPTNELELPEEPQPGDITYYNGSSWQRVPTGAVGQVLRLGSGGVPTWTGEGLLEVTLPNNEILYVHPTDNSTAIVWGDSNVDIPGVVNQLYYDDFNGAANTQAIVAELGNFNNSTYAARLCADLVAFGFDDWYLPALGELNTMYQQLGPVSNGGSGEITDGYYWSSSEDSSVFGYNLGFENGVLFIINKFLFSDRCRCVRR